MKNIVKDIQALNRQNRESRQSNEYRKSMTERAANVTTGYTAGYNALLGQTLSISGGRTQAYESITNSVPQANRKTIAQQDSLTIDWI